jgi:hypothetical protein
MGYFARPGTARRGWSLNGQPLFPRRFSRLCYTRPKAASKASEMTNIVDVKRMQLERERRWDEVEIARLKLLTRIGALSSYDTDQRIAELEHRVRGLTDQLNKDHHHGNQTATRQGR